VRLALRVLGWGVMVRRPGGSEGRPLFLDPEGPEAWGSTHSGSSSFISVKGSAVMVSFSMVVVEVEGVASRSAEVMVAGRSRLAGGLSVFRGVMKGRSLEV